MNSIKQTETIGCWYIISYGYQSIKYRL